MIITVASFKGGVGKTMTAIHLAAYFSLKDGDTLLVDGDPNRSAMGWTTRGDLPFEVCDFKDADAKGNGRSHIIIDSEAHPSSELLQGLIEMSNLLILPTQPQAMDMEATIKTVNRLPQNTPYRVLLCRIDSRKKSINAAALEALEDAGIPTFKTMVRSLAAYEKASMLGVPVYASGDAKSQDAWAEFQALGHEVESIAHD
ncbi:MAG: ParA family protein [Elainellaceae cyanobacterium]